MVTCFIKKKIIFHVLILYPLTLLPHAVFDVVVDDMEFFLHQDSS
jgi:hypothetical protein